MKGLEIDINNLDYPATRKTVPCQTKLLKLEEKPATSSGVAKFTVIDLACMKEVNPGYKEHEKGVTEQFIKVVSAELDAMEKSWLEPNLHQSHRQVLFNDLRSGFGY